MATMNISLPDRMKEWVEAQAKDGRYANSSDYVRDLIRRDQERRRAIDEMQDMIDEGIASGDYRDFDAAVFKSDMRRDDDAA